jgi:DNA polymerase I
VTLPKYIVDIEADGLLDTITKVHCIVFTPVDGGDALCFHDDPKIHPRHGSVTDGLVSMADAEWVGHNLIGYDMRAIRQIYPKWSGDPAVFDTVVHSRFLYSSGFWIKDQPLMNRVPALATARKESGEHSLEAWGYRLGVQKDSLGADPDRFKVFTQEMLDYCVQDTRTNLALYRYFGDTVGSKAALIEQRFAKILSKQETRGVHIDMKAFNTLAAELTSREAELFEEASNLFPPTTTYMKKSQYYLDPESGAKYTLKGDAKPAIRKRLEPGPAREKIAKFNPRSDQQIIKNLQESFGWEPLDFTKNGQAMVGTDILEGLPYPCIPLLLEFKEVNKCYTQVVGGDKSWTNNLVTTPRSTKIYGRVRHIGTRTHRSAHHSPNLGQVPAVGKPFGTECRSCFVSRPGWVIVGWDAQGLEGRVKAHYLARYDGGAYIDTVINGRKEDSTDIHGLNCRVLGLDASIKEERDCSKTFYYAWLYGAGDAKLGGVRLGKAPSDALRPIGKKYRAQLEKGITGLSDLITDVKKVIKDTGRLKLIDGVYVDAPSLHSGLNTLFQGTGARIMKWATVIFEDLLLAEGYVEDVDFGQILHVHDEIQTECRPEIAERVGELGVKAIRNVAEALGFRCPLDGEAKIGKSWMETH